MRQMIAVIVISFSISCKDFNNPIRNDGRITSTISDSIVGNRDRASSEVDTMRTYFENGKLQTEAPMANGKMHGKVYNYFQTGSLAGIYTYKNGLKHGDFKTFYENGGLRSEGYLLNDSIPHGEFKLFDGNGKLFKTIVYDNGKQISD